VREIFGEFAERGRRAAMTQTIPERAKSLGVRYTPHLLIVFVGLLLIHDIFGTHGYLAMRRKQAEIEKVRTDLDRVSKENLALQEDVKNLKSDPHTIEKIAREELGQARPGEVIIKLPAASPTETAAAKP